MKEYWNTVSKVIFGVNLRYKQFTMYATFKYECGGQLYNSGVDEKTAAEDACKAEHILSEQTLEKIRERALETDSELTKPAE